MRKFYWKYALIFAFLIFPLITLYWHIDVQGDVIARCMGFPLPCRCTAWHTSLAYQYFVLETLADLLVYTGIGYLFARIFRKYLMQIPSKWNLLFYLAIVIEWGWYIAWMLITEGHFYMYRPFDGTVVKLFPGVW